MPGFARILGWVLPVCLIIAVLLATAYGAALILSLGDTFPKSLTADDLKARLDDIKWLLSIVVLAAGLFVSLSTHLVLSLFALAVMGAADVVSVVIRFALVQLRTPLEMRGRVSAVNSMFTDTSNYLGDFRAGVVASAIGAAQAVLIGGICVFAIAALWMFLFPQLWRTRTYDELSAARVLSGVGNKPP
jgi:hypothetical protein